MSDEIDPDDSTVRAQIAAGLWRDRLTGLNSISRQQVVNKYVGHIEQKRALEIIKEMVDNPTSPLYGSEDVSVHCDWPTDHVSLSPDRHLVANYISKHNSRVLPSTLEPFT